MKRRPPDRLIDPRHSIEQLDLPGYALGNSDGRRLGTKQLPDRIGKEAVLRLLTFENKPKPHAYGFRVRIEEFTPVYRGVVIHRSSGRHHITFSPFDPDRADTTLDPIDTFIDDQGLVSAPDGGIYNPYAGYLRLPDGVRDVIIDNTIDKLLQPSHENQSHQ